VTVDDTGAAPLPSDCQYCMQLHAIEENNLLLDLAGPEFARDAVLMSNGGATVMPTVGPMTAGHLLVMPNRHHLSVLSIPAPELPAFTALANAAYLVLRRTYGCPVIAFEHGSVVVRKMSGGCLDHAHLHLVPLGADVGARVEGFPDAWSQVVGGDVMDAVARLSELGDGYQTFWDGRSWWIRQGGARPQAMRKAVAESMDDPFGWDWALFPNVELMRRTVDDVRRADVSATTLPPHLAGLDFAELERSLTPPDDQ